MKYMAQTPSRLHRTSGLLRAEGLRFSYGRRQSPVLEDCSLVIPAGSRTLLLGANGAGKTTLLSLLAGLHRPHSGTIRLGDSANRSTLLTGIGWMPQHIGALRGLSVAEQLRYAGWLAGLSRREARTRATQLLEEVQLTAQAGQAASSLSGGQLRRLGLAQALQGSRQVLLLDEPTAGLDPAQTNNFRRILRNLDLPGGIVVSTHQVGDLADDIDHVLVLHNCKIAFAGSPAEFAQLGQTLGVAAGSVADIFERILEGGLH